MKEKVDIVDVEVVAFDQQELTRKLQEQVGKDRKEFEDSSDDTEIDKEGTISY